LTQEDAKKRAELELLLMDEGEKKQLTAEPSESKGKSKKSKKKKKNKEDDFTVDVSDSRFKELYTHPDFALDSTHKKYDIDFELCCFN
jgi:hypothetical protein